MTRAIKTGEEQDVHTRVRHFLIWRAGAVAAVKRRTRRRERREAKADLRRAGGEDERP